jgi:hypothetical protein
VLHRYDTSLRWFMVSGEPDPAGVRDALFQTGSCPGSTTAART